MKSPIHELYNRFHIGLESTPGPQDPLFADVWASYSAVTRLTEYLLLSDKLGCSIDGADEVALYSARFSRVASISVGMPLRIPTPSDQAIRAMGRLIEDRSHIDDVGDFLELASPIVNDLSTFASTHLGRLARPVLEALSVTARSAALMNHCVTTLVPGLYEREARI